MPGDREPPAAADPRLAGIADPDPGRGQNALGPTEPAGLEAQSGGWIAQVETGQRWVEPERRSDEAGTGGQSRRRRRRDPGGDPGPPDRVGLRLLSARIASLPERPGGVHAIGQLDGPNEHGGRAADWLGDDVQTGMHAVDKVQVGAAGLAVHHGVAGGPPETGVRGAVVLADVRLDLDDPTGDPSELRVVGDEPTAEQVRRSLEGWALEERAGEWPVGGQVRGKSAWMSDGRSPPSSATNSGMSVSRKIVTLCDSLTAPYRFLNS